jgi:hypothetical protein
VDLAQILPVLTTVNDSFDFSFVGTNGGTVASGGTPISSISTGTAITAPANLGTSLSQVSATGGFVSAVTPGGLALGGAGLAITPIAGSNVASSGVTGSAGTTGSTFTSRREVLRALILLQDDVEQMLSVVNGLNGGNAATLNASTTLTPTGR